LQKFLRLTEYGFTVFALLMYTGAVLLLVLSGGVGEEVVEKNFDTTLYKLTFIVIYLVTCILLARRSNHALYTLTREPLVFIMVAIAAASVFWSWTPNATINQSTGLIGSSLFGLYLATRYSLKQQLYLLCWTFGIIIFLSFMFAILLPKYGLMGGIHTGAWRGVFTHKNGLGAMMTNSIIFFSMLMLIVRRYRWLPAAGVLLSMVLLALSRSTSALVITLFVLVALSLVPVIRLRYLSRLLAIAFLAFIAEALVILFLTYAEVFANFFGKDLTLTGRTILWEAVWEMIQKNPWLGYGFGGFWNEGGPSDYIWLATGWKMTHPHNGFLELWLDLGIVGLALFLMSFLRSFLRSLTLLQLSKDVADVLPFTNLVFLIVVNFTESSLMSSNSIWWILYVSLSVSVAKELARRNRITKLEIKSSDSLQEVYSDIQHPINRI
jgi:exopolysaccharide production protein ExoQ